MRSAKNKQKGFVSIFVVIFTAILISVITISFIRIMITDQQQATTNDLSRSAYDSAQAGVEDAKRALLNYISVCNSDSSSSACQNAQNAIDSSKCNSAVGDVNSSEVAIKTGDSDSLNQAYTCVKIAMNTDNYLGSLKTDGYKVVPLSAVSGFNTIEIEWYNPKTISLSNVLATPLLKTWAANNPPILRAQVTQISTSGFSLSDLDGNVGGSSDSKSDSGANTVFFYPTSNNFNTVDSNSNSIVTLDGSRGTPIKAPKRIQCNASNPYACTAFIKLPKVVTAADHNVFLNLSAMYSSTNYRVTLLNDNVPVKFNAVQPEIDSTGRANDLFRRVKTRVELTDVNFPYPEAAVDITGSFCKDFSITDDLNDYNRGSFDSNVGSCGN